MNFKFRTVQFLTGSTMIGYWLVRLMTDMQHLHPSMLVMALVALVLSELGFRAGKKEVKDSLVVNK